MYLSHLSLKNFRSYGELELPLTQGVTIFLGKNGEGKTNIVESMLYLAFLSSHRTSSDQPLVRLGENSAYIRARIVNDERDLLVELEINAEKANRARINQNPVRSQKELFGALVCVYFSPEDLDLVRGDPAERRRFIDQLITLRNPRMAGVISDYDRAVRQRNSLLKTRSHSSSLQSWDEQVALYGGEIIAARLNLLNEFTPVFTDVYREISTKKPATIGYKSSIDNPTTSPQTNSEIILQKMNEIKFQELERGLTLVGPHRDDLLLQLGDHLVKGYASHGESWSIALSLKLASYQLLREEGAQPILILDDVFSELDEERRDQLVALAHSAEQTFVTVAVASDLPADLTGTTYQVKSGSVKIIKTGVVDDE